jgi:ribonuclease P/MRP protein subunit POP5
MVRIKHRYLLAQILYPSPTTTTTTTTSKSIVPDSIIFHAPTPSHISASTLLHLLRTQISLLFGDYGSGVLAAGLSVRYFSNATSTAIIRCPRAHYRLVWAALTFLTELPAARNGASGAEKCVLRVVRVSGTIKKVEEEAVRRARRMISAVQERDGSARTLQAVFGAEDERGIEDMDMEDVETSDEG